MEFKEVEHEGFVIKCYVATIEHAEEYGIKSNKPLFLKELSVEHTKRNNGYGKKLLEIVEDYANSINCDIIFGNVPQDAQFSKDERITTFSDTEMIRYWLFDNGYAINPDNNDFHKVLKPKSKLKYYGGVGFKNCAEISKYEVFTETSTKSFNSLSEAKEFYENVKGEKSIWNYELLIDAWYYK